MKVALITGSSKGLGLQVAKLLAAQEYKIILTGRSQKSLEAAREQLIRPKDHHIFCGDLLEKKFTQALCDLDFQPEVIVHNLGGKIEGDGQPLDASVLIKSIELNLGVAANINAHYFPLMQKENYGRVIHVGSNSSKTGRSAPGHVAAKGAVNAYVKSAARFYAQYNMMICAVLPSIFLHEDSAWDQKRETDPSCYQKRLEEMPLGRFLLADEIADVIANIAVSTNMAYSGSLIELAGGF